jgi:hypothetical protein
MNETCHCHSCNKIITISNRINHENTEFHKNNLEQSGAPKESSIPLSSVVSSFKTCLRCTLKLNKERQSCISDRNCNVNSFKVTDKIEIDQYN